MKKYDLIVAGGGLSGVAAAVSAAREGLSVLLLERAGCLGGAMSNSLVYPFMNYWTTMPEDNSRFYLSRGLFREMLERERQYTKRHISDVDFVPEYMKLVLDDMVTEAGVDVLFHAGVIGVETEGRQVKAIQVATASGVLLFSAEFFVDATGNGDLFFLAGCDYQLGRESDGLCQPMTLCFRMSGVDIPQYEKDYPMLQEKYRQAKKDGIITNPQEDLLIFTGIGDGILHFNTTRVVKHNPTDAFDVSHAEMEARKQIHELVSFLKEHSKAFANGTVTNSASEIGIRESRKLKGMHILTEEELKNLTDFEDVIALGNYAIDIHNPTGSGTSLYYFKAGDYYKIPYRSLLPKEYENLIVAGRCISATHEAQASIRIMPTCACMGEAAGMAAAVAHHDGKTAHTVDIRKVQEKLIANGAILS